MTNDEMQALVALNGEDTAYNAHLSGYDIMMPVKILGKGGVFVLKHQTKAMYFSGANISDLHVMKSESDAA